MTLEAEDMAIMRDFYTRVIGLEETGHRFYEDAETDSPTPGAVRVPGANEIRGVSWDLKIEEQRYKDENHDLVVTSQKYNRPPGEPRPATSPFYGAHVGYVVDDLAFILRTMEEERLGEILGTGEPDGAPNRAFIFDPEGNALELRAKQPDE